MKARLALVVAVLLGLSSHHMARAEEATAGPWYVDVEPSRAVAALDDTEHAWTLMVRCVEGHVDLLIRRYGAPMTEQTELRRFAGELRVDSGEPLRFPAQTWSLDGILVPDARLTVLAIQTGHRLEFAFSSAADRSSMTFLSERAREALLPVLRTCGGIGS